MANRGVAPLIEESALGRARRIIGDTTYKALDPVETGFGDYGYFSDPDIYAFLGLAADNVLRAAGYAFRQLAAGASLESSSIAAHDLRVDTTKRGSDLNAIANSFFADADLEEQRALDADSYFSLRPIHRANPCCPDVCMGWCN